MRSRTNLFSFIFFVVIFHIFLVPSAVAVNKIMPLGDSLTNGTTGSSDDTGYRRSLYFSLTDAGYNPDFVGSLNTGIPNDFDRDHEGHGGFTDDQVAADVYDWLTNNPANIVLLHIGTNGLEESAADVETILDEIERFENDTGATIWVVLARIINRSCITENPSCPESVTTNTFNINVANMAKARILSGDKVNIVDMENGDINVAVIDYHLTIDNPPGDMLDDLHPFDTGYDKMADLWFSALMDILPQADAGPVQNVSEFDTVTLDGSGSIDPKNGTLPLTYQWVQTAGPSVALSDAQAVDPTFEAPDAGLTGATLTFTLTVTDEDELVSTDTVNVLVAKIAPQAHAGLDQSVNESATVTLDASRSVGVGLSYQWTQTAGSPVVLSGNQDIQPFFAAPAVGPSGEILTFELTVSDDDNVSSTDTVNIAVKTLPQADAGPDQNVDEFDPVTLDASGSVAAGALSYQWTQTAGTTVALAGAATVTATFTAPDVAPGSEILTFRLTVRDADDLESTDTVNITVNNHTVPDSGGGGGGGGGGCFIATAANSSPITLSGKVPHELRSRFAMLHWKRLMPRDISLPTPCAEHAATLVQVLTMVVLIISYAAITFRKPCKRWLKL